MTGKPKLKKGFALMDPEKRKLAAAKGGRNSPRGHRPFKDDPVLASEAGKKGVAKREENRKREKGL